MKKIEKWEKECFACKHRKSWIYSHEQKIEIIKKENRAICMVHNIFLPTSTNKKNAPSLTCSNFINKVYGNRLPEFSLYRKFAKFLKVDSGIEKKEGFLYCFHPYHYRDAQLFCKASELKPVSGSLLEKLKVSNESILIIDEE